VYAHTLQTDGFMIGSHAVVGLPEEGTVQAYTLWENPGPSRVQDLRDTKITQTNGETVLEFTRPLLSENGDLSLSTPQHHLVSYSTEGNDFGYHTDR
jgi:hypothetical protein